MKKMTIKAQREDNGGRHLYACKKCGYGWHELTTVAVHQIRHLHFKGVYRRTVRW